MAEPRRAAKNGYSVCGVTSPLLKVSQNIEIVSPTPNSNRIHYARYPAS